MTIGMDFAAVGAFYETGSRAAFAVQDGGSLVNNGEMGLFDATSTGPCAWEDAFYIAGGSTATSTGIINLNSSSFALIGGALYQDGDWLVENSGTVNMRPPSPPAPLPGTGEGSIRGLLVDGPGPP